MRGSRLRRLNRRSSPPSRSWAWRRRGRAVAGRGDDRLPARCIRALGLEVAVTLAGARRGRDAEPAPIRSVDAAAGALLVREAGGVAFLRPVSGRRSASTCAHGCARCRACSSACSWIRPPPQGATDRDGTSQESGLLGAWTCRSAAIEYLGADGNRITEPSVLERIRELAIPPAWEDVWICPWPFGHIQATGVDAAGRKQYRATTTSRYANAEVDGGLRRRCRAAPARRQGPQAT